MATKKKAKAKKTVKAVKAKSKKTVKKTAKVTKAKIVKKVAKKTVAKKPLVKQMASKVQAPLASTTKKAALSKPSTIPNVGTKIPAVALVNSDGFTVNLGDLAAKSRHLVLYFYPKDDTPGCTKEACDFRDNLSQLTTHGATVVGISPDSKESHHNFSSKYSLNFTLLADPTHDLSEKMGTWKLKQFMGNSYMGVERSTFLFTNGKLAKVWSPVKVDDHVADVLSALGEG